MTDLRKLYEGTVGATEIDDLGHMNVRYYAERGLQATANLLADNGLDADSIEAVDASIEIRDLYTRHYREQLVGAPLAVMGGALEVDEYEVRAYHELSNTQSGELAATFVHRIGLRSLDSRSKRSLPESTRKSLSDSVVGWPEHGRPRSIDLDRLPPPLSLAQAHDRGLALRFERRVLAEECAPTGFVPASRRQDLVWGGKPIPPHGGGPPMFDLEDGGRMSMAALETRSLLSESPRVGTRIQSFSATVEVGSKTTIRRAWVFDLDRERLLFSNTFVDIALHLGQRRAIRIPPELRARFEATAQLDLR